MQPSAQPIPLRLTPILPPATRQWARPLNQALWRLLVPGVAMEGFDQAAASATAIPNTRGHT